MAARLPDPAAAGAGGSPPAVLVLNPYYSGVGIARSLPRGIDVFALTCDAQAPGARSRRFRGVHTVANGRDEPRRLCDEIVAIARRFDTPPVLFPTRDLDVLFMHEHEATLREVVRLPYAGMDSALRVMDKLTLAEVAGTAGVPVPATRLVASEEDMRQAVASMTFPLVAKPRFAHEWRHRGGWEQVGAQKAFIVQSAHELAAVYRRIGVVTPEVLVQEYVPGEDQDIVVCCCVIRRDGSLGGQFTARKVRQEPPLVGTGSVVMATDVPPIVAPTLALLAAFGYRGIAEVEYKRDRSTGAFRLIEVNPRHWDQHELGRFVGVNISWLAYADITGVPTPPGEPSYEGRPRKWLAEAELVAGAARQVRDRVRQRAGTGAKLREGAHTLREVAASIRGHRVYAMWRLSDVRPGLAVLRALFGRALSLVRRKSAAAVR